MTIKVNLITGVEKARFVVLDQETGLPKVTGGVIKELPTLKSVNITKDSELTPVAWDNEIQDSVSSGLMKPTLEFGVMDIAPEILQELNGLTLDGANLDETGSEVPVAFALMFDVTTQSGTIIHHTFYKCKLATAGSKKVDGRDGTQFKEQPRTIKATFMYRKDVGLYDTETYSDRPTYDLRAQELRAFGVSDIPAS